MIYFNLDIRNPFSKPCNENIKTYFNKTWKLSENKSFEIQVCRAGSICTLLGIELDARLSRRDHAGINFYLDLCSYVVILNVYDKRHWDFEYDAWEEI